MKGVSTLLVQKQEGPGMAERLPATLVSGLVVGAAARGLRFGHVLVHILIFAAGAVIGWLIGHS